MKKTLIPTTLALILVSAMFILAIMTSGCTSVHELRGNKDFENLNYASAIAHYNKVPKSKVTRQMRLNRAEAYRSNNQTKLAEAEYRKVTFLPDEDVIRFAEVLMINGKYADARKLIRLKLRANPDDREFQVLLTSCDSLPVYLSPEPEFKVALLPSPINKSGSNFGAAFFKDGIVFASERPSTGKGRQAGWTGQRFLDLFFSTKSQLGEWSEPVALDGKVNTPYHEGIAAFSPDGKTVFFTRNNFLNGRKHEDNKNVNNLQLYYATQDGDAWKSVKPFTYNSRSYSTGHPSMAADGQTLYFISDMPGGYGGTDIYATNFSEGEFSEPVNLGSLINTPGNEMFPSIHPDGSLHFASDGHPGLGGLDIFRATYDGETWGSVVNMRAPLNSSRDDFALVMDESGENGYFSSNRLTEDGTDEIFSFERLIPPLKLHGIVVEEVTRDPIPNAMVSLAHPVTGKVIEIKSGPLGEFSFPIEEDEKYVLVGRKKFYEGDEKNIDTEGVTRPMRTVLELDPIQVRLEGIVKNNQSGKPIANATVTLEDHSDNSLQTATTSPTGEFNFPLNPGTVYTITGSKQGFNDDYESVSTRYIESSEVLYAELGLDSFILGQPIVMENIYYDFDSAVIRTDAALELDKLVKVLNANPTMNIEMGSHTDSRGNDAYNQDLSHRRARSAVAYLIKKGIASSRLTYQGYGESKLVNECSNGAVCSEEDHQLNRRTEFTPTSYRNMTTSLK